MDTGIIIVLLMLIIVLLGFLIFNMKQTKPTEIKVIRERERPITKERIIVMEPETSIWSWSPQWPWWQSTRSGVWGGYGPYHGRYH